MDPLKQRLARTFDSSHSLAELDPQSTQEASVHSPSITPDSVHRRTPSNNAVDGNLEGTAVNNSRYDHTTLAYDESALFEKDDNAGDHSRILDLVDSTNCYQRTDIALQQAPSTPVTALSFNCAVRPAETISSRQYPQRQDQKRTGEWNHIDQLSASRFINSKPPALQQQQTTIPRPARFSLSVPSNTAPTVFALASSLLDPIFTQLSINPPNQPIVEQDPVPQKTATEAAAEVSTPPPTAAGLDSKAISSVNDCVSDKIGVELSSHPSNVDGYLSESDVNIEALRVKEMSSISKFDYIEKVNEAPTRDKEESIESLVESMDWSKTGLGPRSGWPRELATTFQVLLKSPSPLGLYWGDKNYMLYNDVSAKWRH
ncbi:hypothetical protein BGZ99_000642 [Dissophora globulifera]|uniref:Uncharacterized protein n=1 Tax=Dissophora globulifera TaxID=979702 RepID=A0A9P6R0D3_9FUNG|nr:hypothetical protein BGZ99_000642 [Dissophora globulifera]